LQTCIKTAGSLILSCLALTICLAALLLGFVFKAASSFVLFTVILPPLLLITSAYAVVDLFTPERRKQAFAALILILPIFALLIWFYRNLDL
jgi:hypothetical protein